jgi:hypothetical protein
MTEEIIPKQIGQYKKVWRTKKGLANDEMNIL